MRNKKIIASTVAIATAAAIAVTTVLSNGIQNTYAQESFTGLDEIIAGKQYKILEIVPDMSEAKLGLLVNGQETYYDPASGRYGSLSYILSGMGTKAERETYVNSTVKSAYADIITESDEEGKVLSYTPYQESYVSIDGYSELTLASSQILDKASDDLIGYYIKDLGENATSGHYTLDSKFIFATGETSATLYSQNVSFYDVGAENKYYNVLFKHTDVVPEGQGAYEPVSGAPITQEVWDTMTAGSMFYMLSDDGASFVLCEKSTGEPGVATPANATEDNGLVKVADFQADRFYMVVFRFVSAENISSSRNYYVPYYVEFSADADGNGTGSYGAVLNSTNPYIEDRYNGHFIKDVENMFYMKTESGGRYELTTESEGAFAPDYDVEIDTVYYTGGLTSTDLMKSAVFNQSGLLSEEGAELDISVDTVLPISVTVDMANEYDLIYVSNSFAYNLKLTPDTYTSENDLKGNVADIIYSLVIDASVYKPIIVDAGIIKDGIVSQETNIYKLARLLSSSNLDDNSVSSVDNVWTVNTYGDLYSDPNSDSYFVHGNVLSVPGDGTTISDDGLLNSHTFSFVEDFASPFVEIADTRKNEYVNFDSDSETAFSSTATALGFGEVSGCISDENFIRESENLSKSKDSEKYKFFDLSISRAICMEYIICYVTKREASKIDVIKVLDIEPSTLNTSSKNEIETDVKNLLGITDDSKISFVHMTSAELISKVEDLCRYDLIYMGLYTDSMHVEMVDHYYLKSDPGKEISYDSIGNSNNWWEYYNIVQETVTSYNDSTMHGLIYSNIGDLKKGKQFAGLFDTDYQTQNGNYVRDYKDADGNWHTGAWFNDWGYSTQRYSGNDLTEEKLNDLLDFVKSACPVILADNFVTNRQNEDGTYSRVVNDYRNVYEEKIVDGVRRAGDVVKTTNGPIDNCSNMYTLIDSIAATTTYKNVKTMSEWQDNKSLLSRYITLGKPELNVMEQAKVTDQEYFKTDGDKVIINFKVKTYGSVDTQNPFNVDLYVDFNADGRYSKATERLDVNNFRIYLIDEEKDSKKMINIVTETDENGNTTEYYSIAPLNGQPDKVYYRLEYTVQKDYLGVYPVKMVVSQEDNAYRYSYWEGYYYHEKTSVSSSGGTSLETVKVLHILPNHIHQYDVRNSPLFDMDLRGSYEEGTMTDPNKYKDHDASAYFSFRDVDSSVYSGNIEEYWKGNGLSYEQANKRRWDLLIESFKKSSFYKYAYGSETDGCMLGGYSLEIGSIFCDTLIGKFWTTSYGVREFDSTAYQEYLDQFDMLVLGFGDCVEYFSTGTNGITPSQQQLYDYYYDGIHNFIASGKSVLFTHDTTDNVAAKSAAQYNSPYWGSGHMSDLLAGDVGFDRYGIYNNDNSLLSLALSAGIDDLKKDDSDVVRISKYPSLEIAKGLGLLEKYDAELTKNSSKDEITKGLLYTIITKEAEKENKDIAYQPNSNKEILTYEVQGRSTIALNRNGNDYGYDKKNLVTTEPGKSITNSWGESRTTTAELLNKGQILIYPYNVYSQIKNNNGLFKIASTHYQYFQIDMNADEDEDGESDITVWLSLTDDNDTTIEYDSAERDARNNYYIYTKGNVTYSGVGHSRINKSGNDAEVQLYINTMIAAYQATAQNPEISIKETADSGSADKDTIYVSMDASISLESQPETGAIVGTVNDGSQLDLVDSSLSSTTATCWKASVDSGKTDSYEKTYVFIQDTNVNRGTVKNIDLKCYMILDSKEDVPYESLKDLVIDLNDDPSVEEWAIPLDLDTYSLVYDSDGNQTEKTFDEQTDNIVSGKTYCIHIPYYLLADGEKRAEIRCYATTRISKQNTITGDLIPVSTSQSYDSVYLQRISLFDLQ